MVHSLKIKEELKKFKETRYSRQIYQNKLDETYFQHDIAYEGFKDLPRRTVSYKVLRDKAFNLTKNPKHDGCERGLASIDYKFFDKTTSGGAAESEIMPNQ